VGRCARCRRERGVQPESSVNHLRQWSWPHDNALAAAGLNAHGFRRTKGAPGFMRGMVPTRSRVVSSTSCPEALLRGNCRARGHSASRHLPDPRAPPQAPWGAAPKPLPVPAHAFTAVSRPHIRNNKLQPRARPGSDWIGTLRLETHPEIMGGHPPLGVEVTRGPPVKGVAQGPLTS